ncbi:SLBB domain-containing protein [Photobacterium angustum]|uniref:SLBB domain-containing protein n=1 Tax=Photobacterium angustum TaxID=661 RepID=UPI0005E260F7|nr:SLBB domain-containing protein [Photobacterium angustum]KJG00010.1 sugar ABC transporter substrate-binding protein [Photobacterium angustum]KJG15217.1 sugar ABC transporter substrate-binding protein [Photobacterium angustum]KJG20190.1 sugar ABC transporter substrate-binding protein [Photobacterium angustum]KJG27252.1 sugar ABC transporter substrate-binding protein [Photobacterium angustum]PSV60995.1 sugar ABC transporter substrate-binding protein [Photobacterium angustum]
MIRIFCLLILFICSPLLADNTITLTAGDRIFLFVPGEKAFRDDFTIDDNGKIQLPEVGTVSIANLTIQEAEQKIKQKLSSIYLNLNDFKLTLKEQLIRIHVLGYVEKPGTVSLKPNSNIQLALAAVGGARPGAQLDKFSITQNGTSRQFNYKKYLDTGDPSSLPTLKNGDTVFVPVSPLLGNIEVDFDAAAIQNTGDANERDGLTLFGEVRNPGTFSYKPEMNVVDALMRADGVTHHADVTKIRVITNNKPYQFDLKSFLDTGDESLLPPIKPGTTIFAPIEVDDINTTSRTVFVMGEVKAAGPYEIGKKTRFIDVLANAGGPTRFADTTQIKILSETEAPMTINLVEYTKSPHTYDIPHMKTGDVVFVPEKATVSEKSWLKITEDRSIKIIGAVNVPGRYEWSPAMDFMDLLAHAEGPTKRANLSNIRLILENEDLDNGHDVSFFNLQNFMKEGSPKRLLPHLSAGMTIIVDELPDDPSDNKASWLRQSPKDSIYIFGAVGAPGRYAFNDEQGFLDILSAADGPNKEADLQDVLITHRNGQRTTVSHLNLANYFETGNENLLPKVLPGDVIYIPQTTKPKDDKSVMVIGSVKGPGRFNWNKRLTFLDIFALAGGPSETANLSSIRIIKKNKNDPNSIIYFDLEKFINRGGNFAALPTIRPGDTIMVDELPSDPSDNKSTWIRQNAEESIYVFGSVNAPGRYAFNEQLSFLDILSAADGPNKDANLQQIKISHRNGSHANVTTLNLTLYFETGDETLLPKVVPGDVIYIPQRNGDWLDKPANRVVRLMGEVKNPGRYSFNNQMSLLDLLAEAGGPTDKAYIEKIMIVNSSCCGDKSQIFSLRDYITSPSETPIPMLRPGDTVYVPNEEDSTTSLLRQGLQDAFSFVTTLLVIGAAL